MSLCHYLSDDVLAVNHRASGVWSGDQGVGLDDVVDGAEAEGYNLLIQGWLLGGGGGEDVGLGGVGGID